ncbi:MAG: hypothetical protein HY901_04625 [Deltaproteobacteria bacterium]|nr:hypothetical protein [Deltaproteobacteria bacterium]
MLPALVPVTVVATLLAVDAGQLSPPTYDETIARLAAERSRLAARYSKAERRGERRRILSQARELLLEAIDRELIPAWYGTPWEFYGASERPGEGTIACGYFVTTVLRDAGLRIERVRLAQQASEHIVRTLTPAERVLRLKHQSNEQVVHRTRLLGDGLYVVGLDWHVGFLRIDGESARFCHSSYLGTKVVACEDARSSGGMESGLHVVGDALSEVRIVDWLLRRPIATSLPATRRRAGASAQ